MTTPSLTKSIVFSDIHWGRKNSSEVHNNDCMRYVDWLCEQVAVSGADHIIFMGDWFETRNSLNLLTLHAAYEGMTKLNALGLPIFLVVGNHDCYYRNSRSVHSLIQYREFSNVTVVDEITKIDEIGDGVLLVPYVFHHEYELLKEKEYLDVPVWFGHFEFQGFVLTGQNHKMMGGPKPSDYIGPQIFSGHFHKRQQQKNICYIGNTFPMDYSDAGDNDRGCMIYDHTAHSFEFRNWDECPKYQVIKLSTLAAGEDVSSLLHANARVKCIVDQEMNYEESITLKDVLSDQYTLREFVLEESTDHLEVIRDSDIPEDVINEDPELEDIDHLVIRLLETIKTEKIKPELLVKLYSQLGSAAPSL